MQQEHGGPTAATRKKYKVTTDSSHSQPVAENVLNREFQQPSANRVWLSDITYIWTREGWLYLAAVLDTYSRKIVGWSMSDRLEKQIVLDALRMALGRRHLDQAVELVHHSDRGSQYVSHEFQELLRDNNITCSMSRRGNCWDNAMMESFFATLKKERVHRENYLIYGTIVVNQLLFYCFDLPPSTCQELFSRTLNHLFGTSCCSSSHEVKFGERRHSRLRRSLAIASVALFVSGSFPLFRGLSPVVADSPSS